jgi:hypothetical protein
MFWLGFYIGAVVGFTIGWLLLAVIIHGETHVEKEEG